jgi:hypothetical protein
VSWLCATSVHSARPDHPPRPKEHACVRTSGFSSAHFGIGLFVLFLVAALAFSRDFGKSRLLVFTAITLLAGIASAQVKGAIFTTTSTRTTVNGNIYGAKTDMYLNGGPQNKQAFSGGR